jgi:glycogen(starch) synthase
MIRAHAAETHAAVRPRVTHRCVVEQDTTPIAGQPTAAVAVPGGEGTLPLRVLMLSWEYPPVLVGGLGRHVHALATSLAAAGHQVTVVARHGQDAPLEELRDGVRIVRAPEDPPAFPLATPSLLAWTMAFNHSLTRAALHAAATEAYDVIHAHDWLVTHTAVTLRQHLRIPLVATVHATEAGRHQGWLPEETNRTIHTVEWWLGREADRVVGCSKYMRWEVSRLLDLPAENIDVIPNGVHAPSWQAPARAVAAARSRYAGDGPLLGFAGRLVYEKGAQYLVHALPHLRRRHPGLRLVIAGHGPYEPDLQAQAKRLGLGHAVSFAGFLGDHLPAVFAATDTVVVPSIYEPFGMVALEAAATGAPLAVSATGGLAEIVQPGVTGMTFPAKDPVALAEAVAVLLDDRTHAQHLARTAQSMVRTRYGWAAIAARTAETYRHTIATTSSPGMPTRRVEPQPAPVVSAAHNLLGWGEN